MVSQIKKYCKVKNSISPNFAEIQAANRRYLQPVFGKKQQLIFINR